MATRPHRRRVRGADRIPSRRAAARRGAGHPGRLGAVVGIGASAGGLEAFSAVLKHLPADTGMSFVFVSHLDPKHESILTAILARTTPMPVLEAKHRMLLRRDQVYVIPRNARMSIERGALLLSRRLRAPAENLPIDHFLQALAWDRKSRAIGVILSGTASDGTIGLAAIKRAGGATLVQSPSTARYDGMPRSAIRAGVADSVLTPREIAVRLAHLARNPAPRVAPSPSPQGLTGILDFLRDRTGADFSSYKEATLERRLAHRLVVTRTRDLADYARLLRKEPGEVDALYEDLLIKVTEFFRDPKTFERLTASVLPDLIRRKPPNEPFRVWVPGCSTGEEAYSIAMILFEVMTRLRARNPVQVFGTDLSERAIAVARKGSYPRSIAGPVSRARLKRFFVESGEGYKVVQRVREACVFARQDLTRDPPFSRVDLVTCRNVLIYMGKALQDTIVPIFHYALKPEGCLLLGKAESLDDHAELFTPLDRKHRIYRRRSAVVVQATGRPTRRPGPAPAAAGRAAPLEPPAVDLDANAREEANRLILERLSPAGVVINGKREILEILGEIHPFVRLPSGMANLSLPRLIRKDLAEQMSAAIDLARRTGAAVLRDGLPARRDRDGPRGPSIEVIPMSAGSAADQRLLVLFKTSAPSVRDRNDARRVAGAKVGAGRKGIDRDVLLLRNELADSQEHLRLLMEVRQAAEEKLTSANEELTSSMEELQSANEELQTSHEELESTNEELTTVNDQLAIRNRDLTEVSNDLTNLVTSVDVPIVMLTGDLKLRRSTVAADKVMGLTPADVGRHLSGIRHTLRCPDLEEVATGVLKTLGAREIEVQDRLDTWYSMRLRPYRTEDNRIDGLVIVLFEIDRLKRSLEAVERARNFSRTIVDAVQEPLLVLGADRRVLMANQAFLRTFHTTRAALENRLVSDLEPGGFRSASFKRMIEDTLTSRRRTRETEFEFKTGGAASTIMAIDARLFDRHEGNGSIVLLTLKDITRFRLTERRLVAARDSVQEGRLKAESSLRESRHDLDASRAELRILAGRLIRAQEDERKRVARELHDDLSQRLSALQLGSAGLARLAPRGAPARAGFEAHQEHLAEIVGEVRRLAYDLHPAILTHLGLRAALQSFCVDFSAREEIDVDFSAQKEPAHLQEEIALCLYRVTQEGLRNAARHSGTKSVSVGLKTVRGTLRLIIQDRGRGFEVDGNRAGEGLGLLGMKERVRLVDGILRVRSRPGQGTRIEVRVPVRLRSL